MATGANSSQNSTRIEDLIERRKKCDDITFSLKYFNPTTYKYRLVQSPEEMKKDVLQSVRVKFIISQVAEENKENVKKVEENAKRILDEMAHHFGMGTARSIGYILSKLMRQLFTAVHVNRDGIEKLRAAIEEHPVVYMPTHRSYVDFLLLSYVCFVYGLPLPVVATGLDFMGMGGMNSILRNCGSFFIRRSFANDKLYWNIFAEYVQIHLRNGTPPIEFFVEGTRSRSGKSLVPKLGFLSTVIEPFFKSELTDVVVVPISITYDRTLEEFLYAHELLGVPKPPESTKGLFKVRQILNQNFGVINFTVAEPIALSDFCKMKNCKRISHPGPRSLFTLNEEEQNLCKDLAYYIVRQHQIHTIVSPFALISSLLLTYLQQGKSCISFKEFCEKLSWLKDLIIQMGGRIYWKDGENSEHVVENCISVHGSVIEIKYDAISSELCIYPVEVPMNKSVLSSNLKGHKLNEMTVSNAVPRMLLSHYSNQIIHLLVRPAIIAVVLSHFHSGCEKSVLYKYYNFLEKLLSYDFIFEPGESDYAFKTSLEQLESFNAISCKEEVIEPSPLHDHLFKYFIHVIDPFLVAYKVIYHVVLHLVSVGLTLTVRLIVQYAQACIEQLLLKKYVTSYISLSLDILNNGVLAFTQMKLLEKDNGTLRMNQAFYSVAENLDKLIWLPDKTIKDHLHCIIIDSQTKAKL